MYLDTTIISAYWYEGTDVLTLGRHFMTREWWQVERRHFALLVSSVTEAELRAGQFPRQTECLRMVRRQRYVPVTRQVRDMAERLMEMGIVPRGKPGDALQVALVAVNEVDYLLTWNYAHLANPTVQARLDEFCDLLQIGRPRLVSPETIPRVSLGQEVRRSKG